MRTNEQKDRWWCRDILGAYLRLHRCERAVQLWDLLTVVNSPSDPVTQPVPTG